MPNPGAVPKYRYAPCVGRILMDLRQFESLFKALSDKQRLRILALLSHGPLVVNELKSVLHLSMSTVSQHLTILRYAGLVRDDKQGRWVYYSIAPGVGEEDDLKSRLFRDLKFYFDSEDHFLDDYRLLEKMRKPAFLVENKKEKAGPTPASPPARKKSRRS